MPRILSKQESEVRSCGISRVLKNHTATYNFSIKMKNDDQQVHFNRSLQLFFRVLHKCAHKLPECQSAVAPGLTSMTSTAVTVRRISAVSVVRNPPYFFRFLPYIPY